MGIVSLRWRDAVVWRDAQDARRGGSRHALRSKPVAKPGNTRKRTRMAQQPGHTAERAPGEAQRQESGTAIARAAALSRWPPQM